MTRQAGAIFPHSDDDAQQDVILEQYHQLGCAILCGAVEEWKKLENPDYEGTRNAVELAIQMGYSSLQSELLAFFWSNWCLVLCQEAELDYEDMMSRVGVPQVSGFLTSRQIYGIV